MHAIILMGDAAASETLIGGYICTIGRCSTSTTAYREHCLHMHNEQACSTNTHGHIAQVSL